MKPSTMIVLVLMVPAMLGYLYYGWLLYQTVTSETNPWTKTLFATTFILWLLPLVGLVLFAVMFWREKDREEDKVRLSSSLYNKQIEIKNIHKINDVRSTCRKK